MVGEEKNKGRRGFWGAIFGCFVEGGGQANIVMAATCTDSTRDWTAIPSDILCLIAQRLLLPDCIRLRAVCTSWNSTLKDSHVLPMHFPWLLFMLPFNNHDASNSYRLSLVNLLENRYCRPPFLPKITINNIWCFDCVGHRDGWLIILHNELKINLLNPVTGARIPLPSIPTLKKRSSINKIILSASPSAGGVFIAMAIYNHSNSFAFMRVGDEAWSHENAFPNGPRDNDIRDCVYHDGKFFIISFNGQLVSLDLNGLFIKLTLIDQGEKTTCDVIQRECSVNSLVSHSSSGSLFKVDWDVRNGKFVILKFTPEASPCWVEIKDLGDLSLFLDGCQIMMLSARYIPGLRRNCIYIAPRFISNWHIRDVMVYDIEKKVFIQSMYWKKEPLFRPNWFMPSLS